MAINHPQSNGLVNVQVRTQRTNYDAPQIFPTGKYPCEQATMTEGERTQGYLRPERTPSEGRKRKKRASPPGVEPGIFWFQPRSGYEIVARRLDHWAMRNEADKIFCKFNILVFVLEFQIFRKFQILTKFLNLCK